MTLSAVCYYTRIVISYCNYDILNFVYECGYLIYHRVCVCVDVIYHCVSMCLYNILLCLCAYVIYRHMCMRLSNILPCVHMCVIYHHPHDPKLQVYSTYLYPCIYYPMRITTCSKITKMQACVYNILRCMLRCMCVYISALPFTIQTVLEERAGGEDLPLKGYLSFIHNKTTLYLISVERVSGEW